MNIRGCLCLTCGTVQPRPKESDLIVDEVVSPHSSRRGSRTSSAHHSARRLSESLAWARTHPGGVTSPIHHTRDAVDHDGIWAIVPQESPPQRGREVAPRGSPGSASSRRSGSHSKSPSAGSGRKLPAASPTASRSHGQLALPTSPIASQRRASREIMSPERQAQLEQKAIKRVRAACLGALCRVARQCSHARCAFPQSTTKEASKIPWSLLDELEAAKAELAKARQAVEGLVLSDDEDEQPAAARSKGISWADDSGAAASSQHSSGFDTAAPGQRRALRK